MANAETQTNGANAHMKDANGLIPGITFPEKADVHQTNNSLEEPSSFAGPEVNGRPTTVTLFSPSQLRRSSLLPSLYKVINEAFDGGHVGRDGVLILKGSRLRYDGQLFDELGTAPGTFTYIIFYSGTQDVVGTASVKRYLGKVAVVAKDEEEKRANTWKRFGSVPSGTAAWELSTMAVDPRLQRQGLAGYLMELAEDEIKGRFKAVADEAHGDARATRLLTMITTIKQRNFDFYSRKGFVEDYETQYEKGWLGSERGKGVTSLRI